MALGISAPAHAQNSSGATFRIDASSGAPRILVNGVPRRARFFYGQPASGTITATPAGRDVSFEFVADQTAAASATIHFRFGQAAGAIELGNVSVTDLSAPTSKPSLLANFEGGDEEYRRDWRIWPPDERNTVGTIFVSPKLAIGGRPGLNITVRKPPNGEWPDFHLYHVDNISLSKNHRYRVKFWLRADTQRDVTVAFYQPGNTYVFLGGPPGHYESEVRLAAAAGVNFVSFSVNMPWPAPGQPEDWQSVDSVCDTTLAANPQALMLPRVPVYAPTWWLAAHKDEAMRWEDGDHGGIASPASEQFRVDASHQLDLLIHHLETKYGNHIAGYHPNGQNTGEWFYMDSWNHPLNGYAPCDYAAFRTWLKGKYGTVDALRTAWNRADVDFDNAVTPSAAARHAAPAGTLRDPDKERDIIDFNAFQQQSMSELVCSLAHVVRTATAGRKLVAFFFGYVYEFAALPTGPASSGHYDLRRILNCKDIDVVCSPISYYDRGPGMSAPSMTAAESVALAGKMWLNEDDTRTYLTHEDTFPGAEHVVKTLEETNGELVRNVAQESLRNFATWWMDLPASGWFDDPGMWAEMARLRKLDEPMLLKPTPFHPEIADIIEPTSMTLVAEGGQEVTRPAVYESRAALGRTGAPYGQYLFDDVVAGRVHPRLYYFADLYQTSYLERQALQKAIRNAVSIFSYAPGYLDGYKPSLTAMHELTGFELKPLTDVEAWATPTEAGRKWGLTLPFGVHHTLKPLFAVTGVPVSDVLAVYPDGSAAIAIRRTQHGAAIFCGTPAASTELLRHAARLAGVHLYVDSDCCVYANGRFVALHGAVDGAVLLETGSTAQVRDVLTGKLLGFGPSLAINLRKGETRVLQIR